MNHLYVSQMKEFITKNMSDVLENKVRVKLIIKLKKKKNIISVNGLQVIKLIK